MQKASVNPSSATDTSVLDAVAGKKHVVYGVYASSDTQQVLSFEDAVNGTVVHRQYVAADGGQVNWNPRKVAMFETSVGNALNLVTSASGNAFVSVWYDTVL